MKTPLAKNKTLKIDICAFCKLKLRKIDSIVCFSCFVIAKGLLDSIKIFPHFKRFSTQSKKYWTKTITEITKIPTRSNENKKILPPPYKRPDDLHSTDF